MTLIEKVENEKTLESYLEILEKFEFLRRFGGYWFYENGIDLTNDAIDICSNKKTIKESIEKITKICEKYLQNKDFLNSIKSLGKKGHYYWNNVRYFMYEFEQYLRLKSKTTRQLLDWQDYLNESYDFDHRSIEHILPQTISDREWKSAFSEFSIPERNLLKNSIGNLLPVSQPKNSSLSNKSFKIKKGNKDNQVGYFYGCLSEIQVAMEDQWNAESILTRGIALLSFMEERWGINFGGINKKIDILNLKFVVDKLNIDINTLQSKKLKIPKPPARNQ